MAQALTDKQLIFSGTTAHKGRKTSIFPGNSELRHLHYGRVLLDVPLEELHGSSAHRLMVEQFNLPTLRVEHRIGCRELTNDACKALHVASGSLGTVWDVHDFSIADRPILFQRLQLPPGHRPLEIAESLVLAATRVPQRRAS